MWGFMWGFIKTAARIPLPFGMGGSAALISVAGFTNQR
jgi:hypothetical protein